MEKIIYRSKTSKGLIAFVLVLFAALLVVLIIGKAWVGLIIDVCLIAFMANLFVGTYYAISGNTLTVKGGFIVNLSINIETITKIEPTNSVLSAPALSFDRLEVFYNRYDSVVISPGDKAGFIAKLKEINPGIVVKP